MHRLVGWADHVVPCSGEVPDGRLATGRRSDRRAPASPWRSADHAAALWGTRPSSRQSRQSRQWAPAVRVRIARSQPSQVWNGGGVAGLSPGGGAAGGGGGISSVRRWARRPAGLRTGSRGRSAVRAWRTASGWTSRSSQAATAGVRRRTARSERRRRGSWWWRRGEDGGGCAVPVQVGGPGFGKRGRRGLGGWGREPRPGWLRRRLHSQVVARARTRVRSGAGGASGQEGCGGGASCGSGGEARGALRWTA